MADVPTWADVARQLPPEMPDTGYDALRDKYFNENVLPWAMKNNHSSTLVREEFMKRTQRPGRSPAPRAAMVAASAAEALVDPLLNLKDPEAAKAFRGEVGAVRQEAERQGVGTFLPETVGTAIGAAPYFAPGIMAAKAVGGVAAMVTANAATNSAYEAAKAESGGRSVAALEGAVVGGALAAGAEMIGPLWRRLKAKGVDETAAKALEATMNGADDMNLNAAAAAAVQRDPAVAATMAAIAKEEAAAVKKVGVPKAAPIEPNKKASIRMLAADGKVYDVGAQVGLDDTQVGQATQRIAKHLAQGGEIEAVSGDPKAVKKALKAIEATPESQEQLKTPVVLRGMDPRDPAAVVLPEGGGGVSPTPSTPAAATSKHDQAVQSAMGKLNAGAKEGAIVENLQHRFGLDAAQAKVVVQEAKAKDLYKPPEPKPKVSGAPGKKQSAKPAEAKVMAEALIEPYLEGSSEQEVTFMRDAVKGVLDKRTSKEKKTALLSAINSAKPELFEDLSELIQTRAAEAKAPKKKIGISDMGIVDRFEFRPDGKVYDYINEKTYVDLESAFQANGISLKSSTKFTGGSWVSPQGEVMDIGSKAHKMAAAEMGEDMTKLTDRGWVRLRAQSVETGRAGLESPGFIEAISRAKTVAEEKGFPFVTVETPVGGGNVRLADIPALLENPYKFLRRMEMAEKMKFSDGGGERAPFSDEIMGMSLEEARRIVGEGLDVARGAQTEGHSALYPKSSKKQMTARLREIADYLPAIEALSERDFRIRATIGPLRQHIKDILGDDAIPKFAQGAGEGTPGNSVGYKQRPLANRLVAAEGDSLPILGEGPERSQAGTLANPGRKPVILYNPEGLNRNVITHENIHGELGYHGMVPDVQKFVSEHSIGKELANAFEPQLRSKLTKRGHTDEEVWTYLSEAIRHNTTDRGRGWLEAFVEADESLPHVLRFADEGAAMLQEKLAGMPASVHKNRMEIRLNDLRNRTGSLLELERTTASIAENVEYRNNKWYLSNEGGEIEFPSREALADHLHSNYSDPLVAPELADISTIPEDALKFASRSPVYNMGRAPIHTDIPTSLNPPAGGRVKAGTSVFSFFFRPWSNWVETVARDNQWPELFDASRRLSQGRVQWDKYLHGEMQPRMLAAFGGLEKNEGKRKDIYAYMMASPNDKVAAAKQLNLTAKEITAAEKLWTLAQDVKADLGFGIDDWFAYSRKMKSVGYMPQYMQPSSEIKKEAVEFFNKVVARGELDPRDNDALRVLDAFINLGARERYVGSAIRDLSKLNNMKTADGAFVSGNLQPFIKRHIDYMQGKADVTQDMISSFVGGTLESMNKMITKVNAKLPEKLQLGLFDEKRPQEALGKFMLFSYAGGLGARPMPVLRDSMQIFMSSYGMLGEEYLMKGIGKAFGAARSGGQSSDAWKVAKDYGAILEHNPLLNLYSGGGENIKATTGTKIAEALLKPMQYSNNSNRLASFWGHVLKAEDAFAEWAIKKDPVDFKRKSGLMWLDESTQAKYMQEINEAPVDMYGDIARRMSKELVEVSQWNYRRGEAPGLYKYAAGRLFGQYGTWPMNYIEFVRKLGATAAKDPEGRKALTRLTIAHGAILSGMQAMGVDAGTWVFTQPMAYGGSPIFNAVVNLPSAMGDWETYRGAESRREVVKPIWPLSVPGGLQMENLWKVLVEDDVEGFKTLMGLKPMKKGEEEKGLHALVPD